MGLSKLWSSRPHCSSIRRCCNEAEDGRVRYVGTIVPKGHTSTHLSKAQPEAECTDIPPNLKQNLQQVVFKHHSLSSSSSLEDVEFVRREIAREFSLPDFVMILVRIEHGSIVTTWLLPVTLVATLKDEIQQGKLQFLQQKDVLEMVFPDSKVFSSG